MATRRPPNLWLLPLLLATSVTAFALRWSSRGGRLSMSSSFDDVTYLADALSHLHTLQTKGLGSLASDLDHHPPHSPLMFASAFLGYLLGGPNDLAPYAVHACVLLLTLLCFSWMARHAGLIARSCILLAACLLPISLQTILEFRPDAAAGFFTALGCLLLIHRLPLRALSTPGFRIVALAALALLAKPSVFPATLALFGLACALSIAAERLAAPSASLARPTRSLILSSIRLLIATALVVSPHYLLAGPDLIHYISYILFGPDSSVWSFGTTDMPAAKHLLYYLRGEKKLVGWAFFPGVGIGLAILIAALANDSRRVRFQALAVAAMVLASYLIVTLNQTKTAFLGMTFFAFLTTSVLAAIIHMATSLRLKGRPAWAIAIPCAVLLPAIALFRMPPSPILSITPATRATDTTIAELLARTIQCAKEGEPLVFFPHAGQLSGELLTLEALKVGVVVRVKTMPIETDLSVYAAWFDFSQMVLIADAHADMTLTNFPVTPLLPKIRALLDHNPDFALEMERTTPSGGRIALFARRPGTMRPDAREPAPSAR